MSKITAINEIIEKKNLLRKCKDRYTTSVDINVIIMWLNSIQRKLED